jgi:hypothetical protein
MGETEVCSPISRKGSKAGSSNLPLSPGARSNPSRAADSIPNQPKNTASPVKSHSSEEPEGEVKITGPGDE